MIRSKSSPRGAAVTALALVLGACADRAPCWIDLSRGFRPAPLAAQVARWDAEAPAPAEVTEEPLAIGIAHGLASEEWSPAGAADLYRAPLPRGAFRACGLPPRLVAAGQEYPRATDGAPAVGEFAISGGRLVLQTVPGTLQGPAALVRIAGPDGQALEVPLRPADWNEGEQPGTFWLPIPDKLALAGEHGPRLWTELVRVDEPRELAPFEYRVEGDHVLLRVPPGGTPPAARLETRIEDGRDVGGNWQLRVGRFCANGLPVWSGTRVALTLDVPEASELAFRFVHGAPGAAPVDARVTLDGAEVWRRSGPAAEPVEARVALPAQGRSGAELAFEVDGAPGLGAFFTPVVAPLARGTPGARPAGFGPARPDLVVFLADTFRADALAAPDELTPELARCAALALDCTRARAPAAWTLPSISALLTGLAPGQHGATDEDLTLPGAHVTLAERLHAAGYRTGAITDGSFFAPIFGLDQGFEWFSERKQPLWDLDATVAEARAFLDADDGRPVFLVVHTYRTHQPYRVGPEEDVTRYDAVMDRWKAELTAAVGARLPRPEEGVAALLPHAAELSELYRAGVRDLDRGFGVLARDLERRGFFDHGYLLFTSDHGEALGENGDFFHGQHLWEVKLRVPLFLRGPGVAPRALEHTATLLDVAPTLAGLAGLEVPPEWPGTSLLALDAERPAFAFQLSAKSRQMALVDGAHKLITTPDPSALVAGACQEAYDLAADPRESANLCGTAGWAAELARANAARVAELLRAHAEPERAGVSPELRRQLDGLGYGGE